LPTGRFRRLHLNLPGSPEGAAFDQDMILKCVVIGRERLAWQEGIRYFAAVDMSGGSSDDAVLVIFHIDGKTVVIDHISKQIGEPPFSPRSAVSQFCMRLREWHISKVYDDAYGGQTFRGDFETMQVEYEVRTRSASDLYERLEPLLNQREIELLDHPTLIEQMVGLVWKGQRITHESNSHDDFATAVALAAAVAREQMTDGDFVVVPPIIIYGEPHNVPNSVFPKDAYPGVHAGSPMKPSRLEPWWPYYNPGVY